jgi:hypothetical protein
MKKIYILLFSIITLFSCQKQEFIDTGKANGVFQGTMLEYMENDSYNWDTTVLVIKRAGLEELFSGNDTDNPQITFLGCTSISIMRYMFPKGYKKVDDIPVDECKELILRHVFPSKIMRGDIEKGFYLPEKTGGKEYSTIGGNKIWMCRYNQNWGGIPEAGPEKLYIFSVENSTTTDIASTNIETDNGVVHSLHYKYIFGQL